MSQPTPEEKEALKASLFDAGRREEPPRAMADAGLAKLLDAEAAPRPTGPLKTLGAVGLVVLGGLLWWWSRPQPGDMPGPRIVVPLDAGVSLVAGPTDAGAQALVGTDVSLVAESMDAGSAESTDAGAALAVKSPRAVPVAATEDEDSLARELTLLDAARKSLHDRPEQTLTLLDSHSRDFPRGAMKTEALLLRVEVLASMGRAADAAAVARKIRATEKNTLVLRRLSQLLDAGTP